MQWNGGSSPCSPLGAPSPVRLEEAHTLAEGALAFTRQRQERGNEACPAPPRRHCSASRSPRASPPKPTTGRPALAEELGMRPLVAHCHRGSACSISVGRSAGLPRAVRRHCTAPWT
jgi:hypothetical protein